MLMRPKVSVFDIRRLVQETSARFGQQFTRNAFLTLVCLPATLLAVYYLALASDRYASESKVLVKVTNGNSPKIELSFIANAAGMGMREPLHVRDYILSNDMLNIVDSELKYREEISSHKWDLLSRLSRNATREEFLEYYRKHVSVHFDEPSSILTIQVDAFTPEYAQKVLASIVKNSEAFLNESNHRLAREQMEFVEKELTQTQNELRKVKQSVLDFQSMHKMMSPKQQAEGLVAVMAQLNTDLVKEEATLKGLLSYMDPRSFEVVQAKTRINALQKQLAAEKARLAGDKTGALTGLAGEFQSLELDLEFTLNKYKAALTALEAARVESFRKQVNIVVIDSPTLPDEALYPRKIFNLATLLVVSCLIFGLVVMVSATVKEHT